jgi:ATP-dependent Clp protease protease subunit
LTIKKNEFDIFNLADTDTTVVTIRGVVGDYWDELSAEDVVNAIDAIATGTIHVKVQSPGGSIYAGLAIHNALKRHPANVISEVDSLAASIASVIVMAGTLKMPENSFLIIHNPWTYVQGESKDLKKVADILDKLKDSITSIYVGKSGQTTEKISSMMDEDTLLSAAEAKELGFADEIIGAVKDPENKIGTFFNLMNSVKRVPKTVSNKKEEDVEITLEMIKKDHPAIANQLAQEGKDAEAQRIKDVRNAVMAGHEALGETLMADGKTTGGEAAMLMVAAENLVKKTALENLKTDAIEPVNDTQPKPGTKELEPTDEQSMKAKWDKDADLRAEFLDQFDSYKSYVLSTNAGLVKTRNTGGAK